MPEFRITLVLNEFFKDYRSNARLFINNEINTIGDLMKYICSRFGINQDFYLTSSHIYLPATEDIRVLKEDDIICAVATDATEVNIHKKKTKHKKKKRKQYEIMHNSNISTTEVINNSKDCAMEVSVTSDTIDIPQSNQELNSVKYKKRKKACKDIDTSILERLSELESSKTSEVTNKNPCIPQLSEASSLVKCKKKKKDCKNIEDSVLDSSSKFEGGKTYDIENKNPFCNSIGNVINDPVNGFSPYSYINNFKAAFRKHVKPMEISTIPKVIQTIHVHDAPPITKTIEINKNMVSPLPTMQSDHVTDQIRDIKVLEVEKIPNESKVDDVDSQQIGKINIDNQIEIAHNSNCHVDIPKNNDCEKFQGADDMLNTKSSAELSDKLQEAKQLLLQEVQHLSSKNNEVPTSTKSLNFESKSDVEDSDTFTEGPHFDTKSVDVDFMDTPLKKRKRKRVKRKKNVQPTRYCDSEVLCSQPYVKRAFVTLKGTGSHLRFDNDIQQPLEVVSKTVNAVSDVETISITTIDEVEVPSSLPAVHSNERLRTEDILKYPILSDKLPKEGDIIAFKLLMMSAAFTPEVSDYIIAHVLNYDSSTTKILVKILEGIEQCRSPEGKLLIKDTDQIESKERELFLNHLLELRLLYP